MSAAPMQATFSAHAPNAALLIDFDNVTMGIRSDLGNELRNLLSSDIIKGKVAVQRAYADWRRYPQYIVPLAESSIDMIMAPAYGSSKKNATDIRLAVDAMELVFTRPEIGTYILLSGDSDFASLVTKLKEYGKYVIGVGIRESSSDLLVMNCDEYYSYNALAGLVKSGEEEVVKKDPWELVTEAIHRMKRNGDVMRSDRLKQVMQELDSNFDEKTLGHSKFSRFTQEAAERGLLKMTKLENGQLEIDVPDGDGVRPAPRASEGESRAREDRPRGRGREERGRGRRGGRGRDREREPRTEEPRVETPAAPAAAPAEPVTASAASEERRPETVDIARDGIGTGGERLTRDEAFDLVRRAVDILTGGADTPVLASDVRRKARDLLGRDSESLNERMFVRVLRDAHDANVVDLRKRGDDWELAPAADAAPIADQLQAAVPVPSQSQAGRSAATAASFRRGMRSRGGRTSGAMELPPELLSLGVVDFGAPAVPDEVTEREPGAGLGAPPESIVPEAAPEPAASKPRRPARGRKTARKTKADSPAAGAPSEAGGPPKAKRRRPPRGRAKKPAATGGEG
ncbi:MAG TPA: NYN domain-containing protein [Gemmatimonadaceae bacterium]|nr:NYN domain-containing protein [Gemmatimonadaceae bacterium]